MPKASIRSICNFQERFFEFFVEKALPQECRRAALKLSLIRVDPLPFEIGP